MMDRYRDLWRNYWHDKASRLRSDWGAYRARWERDTEPGYPMTGTAEARERLALAFADLYDTIGGQGVANKDRAVD